MSQTMRSWLRVAAFFFVVQLALGLFLVREVRARTDGALSRAGQLLMVLAGAKQQAPRTIHLNGATLHLSVGSTERSVRDVLDHFQQQCQQRSGQLGQQLGEANVRAGRITPLQEDALLDGIYRVDDQDHGVVACLDVGARQLSIEELRARVAAFAQSGDLAQLGQLRFVTVERGDKRTVFAALWSEGPVSLTQMFPQHGDVPGHDPAVVPRPVRSRRVLSSWEAGQSKSVHAYLVNTKPMSDLKRDYRNQLAQAGFTLVGASTLEAPGFIAQRGAQSWAFGFASIDASSALLTISSLDEATR